jgi:hypothetical protein
MEAVETATTGSTPGRARLRTWSRVLGAALVLLLASEALWLWQTWPVRELLQPAAAGLLDAPAR